MRVEAVCTFLEFQESVFLSADRGSPPPGPLARNKDVLIFAAGFFGELLDASDGAFTVLPINREEANGFQHFLEHWDLVQLLFYDTEVVPADELVCGNEIKKALV